MMSQERWDAALCEPFRTRVNFTQEQRDAILLLYRWGDKFPDIARSVGRDVGSIKAFVRSARAVGLVNRRNRVLTGLGANPAPSVSAARSANPATVFPMQSFPTRFAVEIEKAITQEVSLVDENNIGPLQ